MMPCHDIFKWFIGHEASYFAQVSAAIWNHWCVLRVKLRSASNCFIFILQQNTKSTTRTPKYCVYFYTQHTTSFPLPLQAYTLDEKPESSEALNDGQRQ